MSYKEDKLIVGAMNNLISFDVTDKEFRLLQKVSTAPRDMNKPAYTECITKIKTVSYNDFHDVVIRLCRWK